jgi:NAD(P)-dependent dehydrogenase (short-subunit alcohol dehydrogenase family)
MNRLEGKAALVTGAGGGIGGAVAELFAEEGADVVCGDLDHDLAQRTAETIADKGGRARAIMLDVTHEPSVAAAVAETVAAFGKLDVLVNAAAFLDPFGDAVELPLEVWHNTLAVNVTGTFLMCRAAIPAMREAGGGAIVNLASYLGTLVMPERPAYVASKGAVIQLTKSLAVDFAADNIRANSVSPGTTETRRLLRTFETFEEASAALSDPYPLKRLGRPREIAQAALYLASDEASFVTGADLVIDGGISIQ